jgi:hypothetical protein
MILHELPIARDVTRSTFRDYMSSPTTPLVIRGAMGDWPAMQVWNFDFFAERFGEYPVTAMAPQLPMFAKWSVETTLKDYLAYLKAPETVEIRGDWKAGDAQTLKASGLTLYAGGFCPTTVDDDRARLIFDYAPPLPDFIESKLAEVPIDIREEFLGVQAHHFVFMSTTGALTPLHFDFWNTHAFLAQVTGRKWAALFPPSYAALVQAPENGNVRAMLDNPAYEHVTGWAGTLEPGDMLILPSQWLHYVETLTPSITYSANWIDETNWQAYAPMARDTIQRRGDKKSLDRLLHRLARPETAMT